MCTSLPITILIYSKVYITMYTFYRTQTPQRKCRGMMKNSIILFRRHIKGRGGIIRKESRRKLIDFFEYNEKFIFIFIYYFLLSQFTQTSNTNILWYLNVCHVSDVLSIYFILVSYRLQNEFEKIWTIGNIAFHLSKRWSRVDVYLILS